MNLAPIYELRSRLRTAMIAGTNLIPEDFRLKRAVQETKPLEALSPVFAKIGQLMDKLIAQECEDREGTLLDVISLVDALLCTQGQVAVEGEVEPITTNSWGSVLTNAPYSQVKGLVEALTTSGEGHFSFVQEMHTNKPELFKDYRVKSAMVKALGASYAELAEQVTRWLKKESEEIVPLLQKDFDPKGKKEMVRRVLVMGAVAGGKCNDFYVKMLPEAEKDVKNELIYALRYHQENTELLLDLVKREKGNAKKMAYYALAEMEDERAEAFFKDFYAKKSADALFYLTMTHTRWASKMIAELFMEQLLKCQETDYGKGENLSQSALFFFLSHALVGKIGPEVCEVYRAAFGVEKVYCLDDEKKKIQEWRMCIPIRRGNYTRREYKSLSAIMPYLLENSIRLTGDEDLRQLAMELYQKKDKGDKHGLYFPAAVATKLLGKEDCSEWLNQQIFDRGLFGEKKNKSLSRVLGLALRGLVYDEQRKGYFLQTIMQDAVNAEYTTIEQPVTQDVGGTLADVLIKYCSDDVDMEMIHFVNREEEVSCKKLEEYFYKRALTGQTGSLQYYWRGLKACGCKRCDGLLVKYITRRSENEELQAWTIYSRLMDLPGTAESFEQETEEVCRLIKEGKIKVSAWYEETYRSYVENIKERKREMF